MLARHASARAATSPAADVNIKELQAHGVEDRFWVARAETVAGKDGDVAQTVIYSRAAGEQNWRRVAHLGTRVQGLANHGPQLALVFPDGSWGVLTEGGTSSGRPLPGGAKVVALAGDGETLWAVGLASAGSGSPATKPATSQSAARALTDSADVERAATAPAQSNNNGPTTATAETARSVTTAPTTAAAAEARLLLFRLSDGGWNEIAELPEPLASAPADGGVILSFAVSDRAPHVAAPGGDNRPIRLFAYRGDPGRWMPAGSVARSGDIRFFKLLNHTTAPVLWLERAGGAGSLWFGTDGAAAIASTTTKPTTNPTTMTTGPVREVPVSPPPGIRPEVRPDAAFANGSIRVVWADGQRLQEKGYDPANGDAVAGDPLAVALPAEPISPTVTFWTQSVVMAAFVFALVASMRRWNEARNAVDVAERRPLALAPLRSRLFAGLIDALPVIVAGVVVAVLRREVDGGQPGISERAALAILGAAVGVYVLHTCVVELIAGRSIGKMLFGLRVVDLKGDPATAGALIIRNALRLIDVAIFFLPLVLILYSPLRQRTGDVAAGTTVIDGNAPADAGDSTANND